MISGTNLMHVYLCRRLACLKYLVLANMLMKSGINPFDSQEVIELTNSISGLIDISDDVMFCNASALN